MTSDEIKAGEAKEIGYVRVTREVQLCGMVRSLFIFIDHEQSSKISTGSTVTLPLPIGKHQIWIANFGAAMPIGLEFETRANLTEEFVVQFEFPRNLGEFVSTKSFLRLQHVTSDFTSTRRTDWMTKAINLPPPRMLLLQCGLVLSAYALGYVLFYTLMLGQGAISHEVYSEASRHLFASFCFLVGALYSAATAAACSVSEWIRYLAWRFAPNQNLEKIVKHRTKAMVSTVWIVFAIAMFVLCVQSVEQYRALNIIIHQNNLR